MAARAGNDGRRDWTLDRVLQTFPRLAERLQHGGAATIRRRTADARDRARTDDEPDVMLILDEATEGLAPLMVREIWRIIGAIRATGIASLIVDRNYRSVLAHTDRCVVLEKGRVVLEGKSAEFGKDPRKARAIPWRVRKRSSCTRRLRRRTCTRRD